MRNTRYSLFVLIVMLFNANVIAQDTAAAKSFVNLHYYSNNNSMQYVMLESVLKKNKVATPQENKTYRLYLDKNEPAFLIGSLKTNAQGKAKAFIPVSLKEQWDSASVHTFIVAEGEEEIISDFMITKAKISLDTATIDGVKNLTATVLKKMENEWQPAVDVELKIGIQRSGGLLSAADEETFTTDSTGTAVVELKKDSIPGDENGNYMIAARVDDNDELGNLLVQKKVPWGTITRTENNFFDQRTLWSTRFRTPYWLLFMAYSIVIGVWGTLIYLVILLFKIKKLSVQKS